VETRGVTFDRSTGVARTDERVIFGFPNGSGEAVGLQYNSDEGAVRLMRDVRLKLAQFATAAGNGKSASAPVPNAAGQEVNVKGSSLDFARDTRLMRLHGPAEAETSAERLTAGEISLAWMRISTRKSSSLQHPRAAVGRNSPRAGLLIQ